MRIGEAMRRVSCVSARERIVESIVVVVGRQLLEIVGVRVEDGCCKGSLGLCKQA